MLSQPLLSQLAHDALHYCKLGFGLVIPTVSVRFCCVVRAAHGFSMDALGHCLLLEHERNYGLGMEVLGHRMPVEDKRNYGLGMDALDQRMPSEHERKYGLSMDALGNHTQKGLRVSWSPHG